MIAFSATGFLLIAGVALFPMLALRKLQSTTWWDYVYPFTGIIVWFPLGMSNVGSTVSLSNFVVEVFWITVLSAAIPWGRWLISRYERKQIKAMPLVLTFLPIMAALVIRLTMPTLPE
jgi:hypothetical protein